jgi:hypothetical protein
MTAFAAGPWCRKVRVSLSDEGAQLSTPCTFAHADQLSMRNAGICPSVEERFPFFFNVRCACKISTRFPRLLSLSGSLFAIPSVVLLCYPSDTVALVLGLCCALLTTTSVLYHWFHHPWLRAADIVTLWSTVPVCLTAVISWWGTGLSNALLIAALFAPLSSQVINVMPIFHFKDDRGESIIKLQWHVATHFLNVIGIGLLGLHNHLFISLKAPS